ncbi:MAG: putative cystine transporter YijE [Paracidovorax wautersii]|uniref:Putative cystine transporter YijE n=1 Tax=Paracidovorax wautersii TaxID=1177982 RepID=A0A7V8JNG8_9BURK|nr:MAG: putative cystine transporter YijE [Paracidovorax wautersii]
MAALWGAAWPWGKVLTQSMSPLVAAAVRFLMASLVLTIWLIRSGRGRRLTAISGRQWVAMVLAAATGVCGYATFFMYGLQTVPSGKAAVVVALNPAMTLVLAAFLLGEHLNAKIALGMVLSIVGVLFAMSGGAPLQLLSGQVGVGELLILGCAVFWSTYTLIGRAALSGVDALATTTLTAVIGAAMLVAVSLWVDGGVAWTQAWSAPAQAWGCMLALALGSTAIAYAWYFDGVQALGASAASGYIVLVPLFGVMFSSLWLGEAIPASLFVGGGLAIAGMALMHVGRAVARPAAIKP